MLGKPGKAQSVGLHLCFQGSRQTASCRQIDFSEILSNHVARAMSGELRKLRIAKKKLFLKETMMCDFVSKRLGLKSLQSQFPLGVESA